MEISDDKIFKIALVVSLVGILGLIFISPYIEVKEVAISEINKNMIEEEVSITGVVEKVSKSSSSNTYFLTINDGTGQIPAIAFESVVIELENSQTPIDIFKNEKVIITGTITEYNSKLELIISDGSSIKLAN